MERSPEISFKTSSLYVAIKKIDHAPGEPLVGPVLSPELYLEQMNLLFTW